MALIWPRVGPGGVLLLAPVLLVWLPVIDAVGWANLNAAVFLLLAAALRYPKAAGVAIGIAAALKLVPILAVAWLIGRRDWRKALIAVAIPIVATVAVVAIKGPDTVSDFVLLRLNQTTVAGPTRWGVFQALGLPDMAGYVVAALLTLAAAWRKSYSLTIIAMLAAIPVLYSHYWLWLLIPAMAIWIPWVIGLTTRTPPPSPLGIPSPQSEGAVPSL
jgi:alpha-1,2-mannosyltransferase